MGYCIKVGVYAWGRFARDEGFYPEDLPADWRLQFFSNEFQTACVEFDRWANADEPGEMVEDLPDGFALALCVDDGMGWHSVDELLGRCGVKVDCLVSASAKPPRAAGLTGVLAGIPFVGREQLWTPQASGVAEYSSIALLPGQGHPRQYREWIEQWLATAPSREELILWLDGATCDYKTLAECRQLVELMGY